MIESSTFPVEVSSLTKYYGQHRGVEDVTFHVSPGEVLGCLGPNGSGKTTVLRVVMGLIRPTSGDVRIEGRSISVDPRTWRSHIGYLPGELEIYENMTVESFLTFVARLRNRDCSQEIRRLARRFELDTSARISGLSKGNKQKVGVVQALMHRPSILVLDEPTSGLDPIAQSNFAEIVRDRRDDGASIILSSHVLQEVEDVADRIVILDHGRVLTVDTIDNLRAHIDTEIRMTFDHLVDIEPYRRCAGVREVFATGHDVVVRAVPPHLEVLRRAVHDGVAKVVSHEANLTDVFIALTRSNHDS
ncbi:MAG: ABC transporter ATP-binding protein [Actinomycetota bacterium]|nr:ABC transporter ATP-binding protein [Actinomycetota bacterium]MDA2972786.1 ABC transporter ATP-binding protein [Actinomycetota bacterium]MDA3002257.1 ABC transporter ATP-binding protein [Actinomycetota bacterium]